VQTPFLFELYEMSRTARYFTWCTVI